MIECSLPFLKAGKVIEHGDGSVLFLFMFAYTIATITQCFAISVFFSRANLAAACGGIIYFCTYLPYPLCTRFEEYMRIQEKLLAVSCAKYFTDFQLRRFLGILDQANHR